MRTTLITVAAAISLTACMKPAGETPEQTNARTQAESDSARTVITANARRYERAVMSGNMDSLAAMYASNAIIMPPNMGMAHGSDAIKTTFHNMMSSTPPTAFTVTPRTVSASGDVAIEDGTWKFAGKMGAAAVADSGMYLIHWHRDGGNWKIMEHIWNSQNPPMAMAAPARH